jgi:RNA polymerase sigma-70 factor, ECF subfamily
VAGSIGSFRQDARFTTWLHTIARNRAADHLRRRRPMEPLDTQNSGNGGNSGHGHEPTPAERMSSLVASDVVVQQILARLPEPYGEVVRLRDVEHRTYDEMVDVLGRPLNTVRSQVARGRALLAAAVDRNGRR